MNIINLIWRSEKMKIVFQATFPKAFFLGYEYDNYGKVIYLGLGFISIAVIFK